MKKLYLIQGIIFQRGHVFGLSYKSGIGTAATIQSATIHAICNGIVGEDDDDLMNDDGYLSGEMNDKWGHSQITLFKLTDTTLNFAKHYANRPPIFYSFDKKEGNVWIGKYQGNDCGTGQSKFIITPIDEFFFEFAE